MYIVPYDYRKRLGGNTELVKIEARTPTASSEQIYVFLIGAIN